LKLEPQVDAKELLNHVPSFKRVKDLKPAAKSILEETELPRFYRSYKQQSTQYGLTKILDGMKRKEVVVDSAKMF
jgi:hypothetical protein